LEYLQFTWLDVLVLCLSRMNYVDDFVTFLFNCVLVSVVSPEEGNTFFRKAVHFLGRFLWKRKYSCKWCWYYSGPGHL